MRGKELRCRLLQNLTVIIGSITLIYSACSPTWYQNKGLWHPLNTPAAENATLHHQLSRAVEAERVFGVIASVMAITAICMSLLFIFCWNPDTNSESKMNPGRILHPGKLLIVILVPTAASQRRNSGPVWTSGPVYTASTRNSVPSLTRLIHLCMPIS
ncbi:uncharacterized protein LOC144684230 isoform X2 [Cetorhinus maximus]